MTLTYLRKQIGKVLPSNVVDNTVVTDIRNKLVFDSQSAAEVRTISCQGKQ